MVAVVADEVVRVVAEMSADTAEPERVARAEDSYYTRPDPAGKTYYMLAVVSCIAPSVPS